MTPDSQITIVSGLPRSGTSLMMQMLACGGMTAITDNIRTADLDNPRGYFELEKVKKIREDASWLSTARGKVFKIVSQLLYDLPCTEEYRVIFMRRCLEEMLASQAAMLYHSGRESAPREEMMHSCTVHLSNLEAWLRQQVNFRVLQVSYNDLVRQPERESRRIVEFLDRPLDVAKMVEAVDAGLYRNRV